MVWESLQGLETDKKTAQWLTSRLLPVVYWHHIMEQTKNPRARKKYRKAWEQASATIKADPFSSKLPISDRQRWLSWAENMARLKPKALKSINGDSQLRHKTR